MADQTLRFEIEPTGGGGATAGDRRGALTLLSGTRAGTVHPIGDGEMTVGRTSESTLAVDDDSLSRRHARFFKMHGAYFVEDLKSTNGTFVNGAKVIEPTQLVDGARVQLGRVTVLRFTLRDDAELEASRRAYEQTVRDALTGAFNRHFLSECLSCEVSYAKRHGTNLSVLFVDADHFKKVNDTHGHAAGDEVLRRLSRQLIATMRSEDVVARYGGEEFVVVVRGIGPAGLLAVAERIRSSVEALRVEHDGKRIPVTVSVGVATMSAERPFGSPEELLAVADGALYQAKAAGRNRVHLA